MKLKVDDKLYLVYFEYTPFDKENPRARRTSKAYIFLDKREEENLLGVGEALCSAHDMFSKKIGRKLAFGRMLKNAGFTPEVREEFWDAWFEREQEIEERNIANLILKMGGELDTEASI